MRSQESEEIGASAAVATTFVPEETPTRYIRKRKGNNKPKSSGAKRGRKSKAKAPVVPRQKEVAQKTLNDKVHSAHADTALAQPKRSSRSRKKKK